VRRYVEDLAFVIDGTDRYNRLRAMGTTISSRCHRRVLWRGSLNQHERKEEWSKTAQDVRRRVHAKIARYAEPERGGDSGEPTGT
jgi:hypothetical protein